ncbi:DUF2244 domain-containing protein [Frateuria aurantia]|uniref:Integral membrane protein n=1 Tax=Frateuria aurantia (strain ATCC 33424 / DSM 6220 / KCTC 2777 / LMG 1558 / NBRC 3245 / NCIMB 13370) TaxID=767434 RepID=H8KZM7_FRAAD|nr:DUF2244 domain-containing protein [Frateuria aurantia]AFC87087.1 integral membrane protein [Frateuria aurantia DSM 6220]
MIVIRSPAAGPESVVLWLTPNRALSRRAVVRVIGAMVLANLFVAVLGAFMGNVFAPLYALLESVVVVCMLRLAWRAGDRGERLSVVEGSLEVLSMPGDGRVSFQTYWVAVLMRHRRNRCALVLRSHGKEVEIGAFLAEPERAELSRKLKVLLADSKRRLHE